MFLGLNLIYFCSMGMLHQLRKERITSKVPVVKVFEKNSGLKIIGIALGKDVVLKEHMTKLESKLVILEGAVEYIEESRSFTFHHFDEFDIPINTKHSLLAKEDSLCLLIQKSNDRGKS